LISDNSVKIHKFPNGITLIAEEIDYVPSSAFSILVPIGAASDPIGQEGAATILAEMFHKGAGPWNSKELSEEFDKIGAHRSHVSGIEVSVFSGAVLAENLHRVLELYSKVLLEPHFPEDELESVRLLALQELEALEDQPSSKVMVELAKQFYPEPFGRCQIGTNEGLRAVSSDSLVKYYKDSFTANRTIIAVAGKFDWPSLKAFVENKFQSWVGNTIPLAQKSFRDSSVVHHVHQETNQLQIALAYPSVSTEHPDYYVAKVAIAVLSGGMSGRLFVEVREKRGLVYRVSASHSATKGRAAVFAYAGTTPENGQETLRVMLAEIMNLKNGVNDDELKRAKADIKSRLIIHGESTSSRASSLVNDWWNLGRVRSLAEIKNAIDAVSSKDIERHIEQFPVAPLTLVTLGPTALELPL
jgi:predicted Zn-dependent peptidase